MSCPCRDQKAAVDIERPFTRRLFQHAGPGFRQRHRTVSGLMTPRDDAAIERIDVGMLGKTVLHVIMKCSHGRLS
jgi:hypothetical protein